MEGIGYGENRTFALAAFYTMPPHSKGLTGQTALLSTDLLTYYRQISRSLLTVVDVETTGSLSSKDRVIEVSVLQASLRDGIRSQETHLINPGVKVPAMITRVTGITPTMVGSGAHPEDVWPDLFPKLAEGVLTAHNLDFDYGFLRAEFRHMDLDYARPALQRFCTVLLSRLLLADLPSRSLPDLVKHFGFEVGPSHRAEADTKACWLLAEYLLKQIQTEPDDALIQRFGRQWIRLKYAAKLLKCPKSEAQKALDERQAECRVTRRGTRFLYRRRDVESLYQAQQERQLSLEVD